MKKKIVIGIVIMWILVIAGFVLSREMILRGGREVFLQTVPVDPRDLFRGDYVVLDYEISRANPADYGVAKDLIDENQTVYVGLAVDESSGIAQTNSFSLKQPSSGIFIKGKWKPRNRWDSFNYGVHLGIESYFIPEGTGNNEDLRDKNLLSKVKIDKEGNAILVGLWLNGKKVEFVKEK